MSTAEWVLLIWALFNFFAAVYLLYLLRVSCANNRELIQALYYRRTFGRDSYTAADLARMLETPAPLRPRRDPSDPNRGS